MTDLRKAQNRMAFGKEVAADAYKVPPRVEVQLPLGETVPLVLEDGRWRIDGPLLEPWGQRTPRAALRTFVRALEQRRYDVLSRLVPARYRPGPRTALPGVFLAGAWTDTGWPATMEGAVRSGIAAAVAAAPFLDARARAA